MRRRRDGARERWRWFGRYFHGRRRILLYCLTAGFAIAASNVALLLLLSHAIDAAIPAGRTSQLLLVGVAMVASRLLGSAVAIWMTRLASRQVSMAIATMQGAIAARLHGLRWRDLQALDASAANARIVHDAHTVAQMAMRLFTAAMPAIVPFLASFAALFLIDWRLAVIVLALLPPTRAIFALAAWRLRGITQRYWDAFDVFHRRTKTLLHMLPATIMHGVGERELAGHRAKGDGLAQNHEALVTGVMISEHAGALGGTILLAVILIGGGFAVAGATMSIGTLTAFLVAATQAQGALTAAAGSIPAILSGDAALARILALQATGKEQDGGDGAPPRSTSLSFDRVDAWVGGRRILAEVSFELHRGQSMAIVAPNGEGKTTLLNIALGLIDCDGGRVAIDGIDLKTIDRGRWRGTVGILPQQPLFADGSLGDNIGFALSDDHREQARRSAALDALMASLPGGAETPVGENGALLSGGERQRAAIARALIGAPSLLVLDEPSNHLDADAVALLIEKVFTARERPTILVATHDARLLRHVDCVYRLQDGRLERETLPASVAVAS